MRHLPPFLSCFFLFALHLAYADEAAIPSDGTTDATAAIQQRLDAVSTKGGEVFLPAGQYLIQGSLKVPQGVCLRGSWDEPHHGGVWKLGTTLLITGGRGEEHGPSAIHLSADSAVKGMTMLWPNEMWNDIQPYPWAIECSGQHGTVDNVTLVNAYQGIWIGSRDGSLHLIRNIYGCVLRRGIFVDKTSDIGRIENVHFNPHYWGGSGHPSSNAGVKPPEHGHESENDAAIHAYMIANLEAFIFARSDWEYVLNTFVWGARDGYEFVHSDAGACNGQFLGIGADYCKSCVQVNDIQGVGLQITNGEFTAFAGDPNTAVVTAPGAGGSVQLVNCNFWGVTNHVAWLQGDTAVTLADCHILQTYPAGAVLAEHGKLIIQGCTFDQAGPTAVIKSGVKAAVITGNLQPGGVQVDNAIGGHAQIGLNETP